MLKKLQFLLLFLLALTATLLSSAVLPKLHLIYFAPFLAYILVETPLHHILWQMLLCGLCSDLLSSTPFGVQSVCYTLSALALFKVRKFFSYNFASISLYTMLIATVFTLFYLIVAAVLGCGPKISLQSLLSDFLLMPIFDGIYAFIWFFCPLKAIDAIRGLFTPQRNYDE